MNMACIVVGLIILILVNIVLGSLGALFIDTFNRRKFIHGLQKAGIVVICFAATYLVGYLNPDIVAVEVNGVKVTVMTGIHLVVLAGYYHYAKQVIEKLTAILNGNLFTNGTSSKGKSCSTNIDNGQSTSEHQRKDPNHCCEKDECKSYGTSPKI